MNPSPHVRAFAASLAVLLAFSTALTLSERSLRADTSNACVFGPEVFRREQGKPQTYARRFSINDPASRYSLEVINGDPDDNTDFNDKRKARISSAQVLLNDTQVVGPGDIKKDVRHFSAPVFLNQGDNTLKVTLNGDPVSMLSVAIVRGDTPPPPDLTPPRVIAEIRSAVRQVSR